MEKYDSIILIGNDAKQINSGLINYKGKDLKTLNIEINQEGTKAKYEIYETIVETLYNGCDEIIYGEDIPKQSRTNIGVTIKTKDKELYLKVKNKLENIVGIEISPGRDVVRQSYQGKI